MTYADREVRAEEIHYKPAMQERYTALLGEEGWKAFCTCNSTYLRRAIRVNTLKATVDDVQKRLERAGWKLTPVPWCKEAFWIQGERLDIGNLLEHQLGYIYIQDPASMLPPVILSPKPGDRVLDMCASPGSKTSQAAALMQNTGVIIANDADATRLVPLGTNLQRLGVHCVLLTKYDGRFFKRFVFDKIMVDAPCSGTGTVRRSLKAVTMWNPKQIDKLSRLQIQLAQAAYDALVDGGVMTYSTCTLEPLENEVVVSALLAANPGAQLEDIELDIVREDVISLHPDTQKPLHPDITKCLRIHPYTNDTEGFFVAKIRKNA